MNIFEALSHGKGCINEENVSSFLGYLLSPNEDHGLGTTFLEDFLTAININKDEILYNFEILLEFKVETCKKCYIDMVFETENHIIAVENKILVSSQKTGQLQNEYDGLIRSEYYKEIENNEHKDIILCYLVPKDIAEECKKVETINNDNCITLTWDKIIKILQKLLQKENHARINPINEYTKQTIKAFINYIEDVINPKYKSFGQNRKYRIYKYSSGKIVVKENLKNGNFSPVSSSRKIIRETLKIKNPNEYTDESMKMGTTRSLGAKLFKIL